MSIEGSSRLSNIKTDNINEYYENMKKWNEKSIASSEESYKS